MLDYKYSNILKKIKNITEKSHFPPICRNHGRDSDKKLHINNEESEGDPNYMAQDKEYTVTIFVDGEIALQETITA